MEGTPTLEINVISAEDLRIHGRPLKKNSLVTVGTDVDHANNIYDTTSLDFRGGSYPTWNEKLTLPLPSFVTSIAVEVRCWKQSTVTEMVGTARIPVSEFREPADYLHFISYRLKERDGKPNGIINLSIRVHA